MTGAAIDRVGRGVGLAALSVPFAAASVPALVAAIAAALVVAIPPLGLAAAAFGVPFGSLLNLPVAAGALTATPLVLLWTAVPWALIALARRRIPDLRIPLVAPLALFVTALALSAWRAPSLDLAVFEMARWIELAVALVLVAGLLRTRAATTMVLISVMAAGAAAGLVGLWMAVNAIGPEAFGILGGRLYRAHGTFGQPNPFGGYMNMVWPIGAGLLLAWMAPTPATEPSIAARDRFDRARLSWHAVVVFGTVVAMITGAALLLSWSRGAWLGAAVGAASMGTVWLLGVLSPPVSRRNALAAGVVIAVVATFGLAAVGRAPGAVTARLSSITDTFTAWGVADAEVDDLSFATVERVAHWEAAVSMWSEAPWLGQGPGHYESVYSEHRLPRWEAPLGHAHNYYLHLLAESGIVGLAGYLLFFGACVVLALRAGLRPANRLHGALGLGLVGVLAAVSFHSLVDNLYVHETTVHLGLLLGLLVAAGRVPSRVPVDSAGGLATGETVGESTEGGK